MLGRLAKTVFAVLVTVVPLFVADISDPIWRWSLIGILASFVAAINFFGFFRPDHRFEHVREPTLRRLFDEKFSVEKRKLRVNQRLLFRVVIFAPCGIWPVRKMKAVFEYGTMSIDPDYHLSFDEGHGLCWDVMNSGDVGWYDRKIHVPDELKLSEQEVERTKHLEAILAIPLKRENSERTFAVLICDALTREAAEFLEHDMNQLKAHHNQNLADLIEYVQLFV